MVTLDRVAVFRDAADVELTLVQFLRAAREKGLEIVAYCFMPDHVHMIVCGVNDDLDFKAFVKLARQFSGYCYRRRHARRRLWQHGSNDHIVRDAVDLLDRLRYLVNNPVAAGLVERAVDDPYLGSERWSREQLVERCAKGILE